MWPLAESFLRNPCAVHGQRSLHLNGATIHTIRHDVQVEPWLRIFYLAEARSGSETKYIRAISVIYVTTAPPRDSYQVSPISLCSGLMHILTQRYVVDILFPLWSICCHSPWIVNWYVLSIYIYILAALMSTFDISLICSELRYMPALWYAMTFLQKYPITHDV